MHTAHEAALLIRREWVREAKYWAEAAAEAPERAERVARLRCMTCNEEFTGFNPHGECVLCYVTYGAWIKE